MSKIIKCVSMQEAAVLIACKYVEDEVKTEDIVVAPDSVSLAENEAAVILSEVKIAAEKAMNEANEQALQIKKQAYDEAHQQGKQDGLQEGQQQGYQEGFTQGHQAGLDEMQHTIAEAVAKAERIITNAEAESKDMIIMAERQIVDIALAVARKILAYEIAENPMVVLPLVKAALQKVSDQEEVVIRVSADDFDAVLLAKKDLQTMVGREQDLKIIVDNTINGGSCIIDTSYGTIDARVDTQFDNIKKALQGVA